MSDQIGQSAYPISYAQLKYFTNKYAGKAASAQDNIAELLNIKVSKGLRLDT